MLNKSTVFDDRFPCRGEGDSDDVSEELTKQEVNGFHCRIVRFSPFRFSRSSPGYPFSRFLFQCFLLLSENVYGSFI